MPEYVYGCPQSREHPRKEVTHGINENPVIQCEACGSVMRRIPQPFRFSLSPIEILISHSEENLRRYKGRMRGYKMPRFSPHVVNRLEPVKGRDFETRKVKQ